MRENKLFKITYVLMLLILSISIICCLKLKSENAKIIKENSEVKVLIKEVETNLKKIKDEDSILKEKLIKTEKELENSKEKNKKIEKEYKDLESKYNLELTNLSFDENDLTKPSNSTHNKLKKALKGTGLSGLEDAYLDAEKEYGLNAIFLVALTAEESFWGNSYRAKYQNNLSGYCVYSDSSEGTNFDTKTESILQTAKLIKEDYLSNNGKYFKGKTIYEVNENYCPVNGYNWSNNIIEIANEITRKVNK